MSEFVTNPGDVAPEHVATGHAEIAELIAFREENARMTPPAGCYTFPSMLRRLMNVGPESSGDDGRRYRRRGWDFNLVLGYIDGKFYFSDPTVDQDDDEYMFTDEDLTANDWEAYVS